jgi:hypothetical protein
MPVRQRQGRFATPWIFWLAIFFATCAPALVRAQNPDELLPADSAAKAKAILNQAIQGLGGQAYLNAYNSDCSGRYAEFEHSGGLGGYLQVRQLWQSPDNSRTEYGNKGNIADLYAGGHGWSLDRGGVSELPAKAVDDYQEQLKTAVNMVLRFRMNENGIILRYSGTDVVDLKQVDWAEVADRAGHSVRIAIDRSTHLPVRSVVMTRDPDTGNRIETETRYSNYQVIGGIQTPLQVVRMRNGLQVYQAFLDSCQYNENLPADYFTRASLDAYFDHVRKKK